MIMIEPRDEDDRWPCMVFEEPIIVYKPDEHKFIVYDKVRGSEQKPLLVFKYDLVRFQDFIRKMYGTNPIR